MRDDLLREVTQRLKRDYGLVDRGEWLREGRCPECGAKKSLYTHAAKPWTVRCGRENNCGWEGKVKELYPEIFDDWSKRFKKTDREPNAAADAYLSHARGFDLLGLKGAYTEEWYQDRERNIGSATVRFPLPGGAYWERLIDQPGRFGDMKARFSPGKGYRGRWWQHPTDDAATLASASELWLAEGIFDALALRGAGLTAVSLMSCNNYPEEALAELRRVAGDLGRVGPKLIFALDVGKAGVDYTRKFVERARKDGWAAGAAQVRPDGEGTKLDWNDLAQAEKLTPELLDEYRWNGDVTIAPNAAEKAFLIYQRHKTASFPLVHKVRQLWATFRIERINEIVESRADSPEMSGLSYEEQWNLAAREAVEITELANCTFRTLYFQRDANLDEGAYYFRIDFPVVRDHPPRPIVKATFSGAACAAGAEFKKRLSSVAPGAQFTGTTQHLDKLMQRQWTAIRMVEAIQHTGYSIDHGAYLFGDLGVSNGRVCKKNEDDYFVFGKHSVKLRTTDQLLRISYDPDNLNLAWLPHVIAAFGSKGVVTLAFWMLSLFAEQIRSFQESLAFLEATGIPGTGKTTLFAFYWKLCGRTGNYEGFDPTKATNAGIARTLGQVGNLPVVLIEGDRGQDTPHGRRFEWDELKTAYNGRAVRTRAIANGGMETFEPPFRGAIAIVQNDPVEASPAMRERIMAIHFDKAGWGPHTKVAAEALSRFDMADVSGFIVHAVRREALILERYRERFAVHETAMLKQPGIRNGRLAKNHAQLAAMLDAMRLVVTNLPDRDVELAHDQIRTMLTERQRAVEHDHPHVETFWERFDYIQSLETDATSTWINHSRTADTIAINLVQFEQRCGDLRLSLPPINELKRLLRTSKARRFLDYKPVNSRVGKTVNCWCFHNPAHAPATPPR
ncbi:MAG: phage-like protein [Sphingomonas bacterium]|nr:phage-like protein [Sphingomonas bacterium]